MSSHSDDLKTIERAARRLAASDQVVELRAVNVRRPDYRAPHVEAGWFNDLSELAKAATSIPSAEGVYIIVNPIDPALSARAHNRIKPIGKGDALTTDKNIQRRRWLMIDADPVRPSGISSTDAEHRGAIERARAIREHLAGAGWPEPLLADSGNGAHLLYRIDLDPDDSGLIERCLRALAGRFDDDSVTIDTATHNPARPVKCYGTRACKGDSTDERPHRQARILNDPDELQVVPVNLLQQLAATVEKEAASSAQTKLSPHNGFDLARWITNQELDVDGPRDWQDGRKWILRTSPLCDHHDGAAYLVQHANGALAAGCQHNSCSWGWRELRERFEPAAGRNGRVHHQPERKAALTGEQAGPVIRCLADVTPERIEWLWPQRLALGKLAVLAGNGGLGKSTVALDITARTTTGCGWPDRPGERFEPGNVVLLSAEDDAGDTIRPRLDAAGADVSRVHILDAVRALHPETGEPTERHFSLETDLRHLEQAIEQIGGVKAIIIDPVTAYVGKADDHRNAEVRGLLAPLAALAARHCAAVLAITHLNKGQGEAIHRIVGSIAWGAAARTALAFTKDDEDPRRRLMVSVKSNIAPEAAGLAYRVESSPQNSDVGVVAWDADPVEISADKALSPAAKPGPEAEDRAEAEAWLREVLADGPLSAREIERQAREAGITMATVRRAKKSLKISSQKVGMEGGWAWVLPAEGAHLPPHPENLRTFGRTCAPSAREPQNDDSTCASSASAIPPVSLSGEGDQDAQVTGAGAHLRLVSETQADDTLEV